MSEDPMTHAVDKLIASCWAVLPPIDQEPGSQKGRSMVGAIDLILRIRDLTTPGESYDPSCDHPNGVSGWEGIGQPEWVRRCQNCGVQIEALPKNRDLTTPAEEPTLQL